MMLVDHQILFRDGLCSLLGLHNEVEVVATASSTEDALELAQHTLPDVVVTDVDLGHPGDGLKLLAHLQAEVPSARLIVCTARDDLPTLVHALRAGALAFIPKQLNAAHFVERLEDVLAGRYLLSSGLGQRLVADFGQVAVASSTVALSTREVEVLELISAGLSNQQIADRLDIRTATVRKHERALRTKLHVEDRAAVAHYGSRGWYQRA